MKAIIAAGGTGTRLRPLTFTSNKHLLPIANKPLLLYALEAIVESGVKDIGIIVNQTRPAIEALLGDGAKWGVNITYINQPQALGLAHVVKIAKDFLEGHSFIYHLGDNIFTAGIKKPFDYFVKSKADAVLTMIEHEENYRLGVPYFDETGKLIKVVEKPSSPPNKFGVPGLYFFSDKVFEAFEGEEAIQPSARGELEVTDLYTYMISKGYRVEAVEVEGKWLDPGKFDDMLVANETMLSLKEGFELKGDIDKLSVIEGRVAIGKGSRVVNCTLVGPIVIGENCLITDSVIGPNVSIDDNTKLESAKVRRSVIMQDCTILNTKREITNSLIGRNTEVWEDQEDTVSLFVGDHCKIKIT